MSERRSSRSRNTVKYSGFDYESDDDFADISSHPPKKPKSLKRDEITTKTKKLTKDKEWNLDVDIVENTLIKPHKSSKTRRAPLTEKIYERELQEALELSILETGGSQDVLIRDSNKFLPEPLTIATNVDDSTHQQDLSVPVTDLDKLQPKESPENPTKKAVPNIKYTPGTIVVDDSIELLEQENGANNTNMQCLKRASLRQVSKRPLVVDSDVENSDESDFKPGADSDGDENSRSGIDAETSDENDAKSDFGYSTKKRKRTKQKLNKNATNAKTSKPLKHGVKNVPIKQQASGVSTTKSSSGRDISSETSVKSANASSLASNHLRQKVPTSLVSQWKPPSRASSNETSLTLLKSPSSGLRLGLSRNQRVKPLHPPVNAV